MKQFQIIVALLVAFLFGTIATAQECYTDPITGIQRCPVKKVVSTTAAVVGRSVSAVGAVITPDNSPLPVQLGQVYSTGQAYSTGQFARQLASDGHLYHDANCGRRENVFYSSQTAFPRLQARVAWRGSPGHRANLPMLGLRVSRSSSGVYVVGRR